jgi:site-specific recombinase XerD
MKIKDLFNDYLKYCETYRKKGTYIYYKKTFKQLLNIFDELQITNTDDFTNKTRDDIVITLRNKYGKKNSKINDTLSALYSALNKAKIKTDIGEQIKLNDDTESFKVLSDEELNKLLRYVKSLDLTNSNNKAWVLAVYLLLDTGVRLNELLNIKIKNIDLVTQSLKLDITKNGKKRIVFYGQLSKALIEEVMKNNKNEFLLFNYITNKKLDFRSIYYFFDKVQRKLKLERKIHPHRLRKTFATKLLLKGCPITTIQKLLGHQSLSQTMIYLEVSNFVLEKDYKEFYMDY